MKSTRFTSLSVTLTLVMVVSLFLAATAFAGKPVGAGSQAAVLDQQVLNQVNGTLLGYSQALAGNSDQRSGLALQSLIQDRRKFYNEYFQVGLYSNLESVRSTFLSADAKVTTLPDKNLAVQATEKVTLRGRYKVTPEAHPMVLAARWAMAKTTDSGVKQGLDRYVQNFMQGARKSYAEGYETELLVRHSLVLARTPAGLQIVKDSFTDQDDTMPGMDNVVWANGQLARNKPDFTTMPDYQRNTMPVEKLGQMMLERATREYGGASLMGSYNRFAARDYANTWNSNATAACQSGSSTVQNRAYWNPNYTGYNCNDCANLVSQSLRNGGHPDDADWYPASYAWVNTNGLYNHIKNSGRGGDESCSIAWEGDIAFISSWGHVVMVTGPSSALTWSAHTSDRVNRAWYSDLTHCVYIYLSF